MAYSSNRLPSRFPVGTKFVIEGRRGGEGQMQVFSRHLEFPDGTLLRLPARPGPRPAISPGPRPDRSPNKRKSAPGRRVGRLRPRGH